MTESRSHFHEKSEKNRIQRIELCFLPAHAPKNGIRWLLPGFLDILKNTSKRVPLLPMSELLQVARQAAREAGKFLKESVGKVKTVEAKSGEVRNLVSEIDRGSEERIIRHIKTRFPEHSILAEESGGNTDPGTTNFLHGVPIFCVTIGVERRGEIVAGVVYDPNGDEEFTAEKGRGAYLNGQRISVSRSRELINSLIVTGFPYDLAAHPRVAEYFVRFLNASRGLRRLGSAALDLAYVAAGRFDGYWENVLQPWDMAAGVLLVEEAGGRISDFDGRPTSVYQKQILASNGTIHDEMIRVLSRRYAGDSRQRLPGGSQ
jgi:myo-inositol-1(or 4)-monophosphatase